MSQEETEKYAIGMYERVNKIWADRGQEILEGKYGFSILSGPPIFCPKLMIIGANGGFGDEDKEPHIDGKVPTHSSILTAEWALARRLRKIFASWGSLDVLQQTNQTNFLLFSSPNLAIWQTLREGLRIELEKFCTEELIDFVKVSKPNCTLVLGIKSFDQHATETDILLMDSKNIRRLLVKGKVFNVPAFGIMHPTGSRVADEDWERVGPHLGEVLKIGHR